MCLEFQVKDPKNAPSSLFNIFFQFFSSSWSFEPKSWKRTLTHGTGAETRAESGIRSSAATTAAGVRPNFAEARVLRDPAGPDADAGLAVSLAVSAGKPPLPDVVLLRHVRRLCVGQKLLLLLLLLLLL